MNIVAIVIVVGIWAIQPDVSAAPLKATSLSWEAPTDAGACRFSVDARAAPDLADWALGPLKKVMTEWYPKCVRDLASEGHRPILEVSVRIKDGLGDIPALTRMNVIELNSDWARRERDREALGCVVHELAHVAQDYASVDDPKWKPLPGWLVEGMADYLRWFIYEPQSRGAELTTPSLNRVRHDDGYRVTANFLDWVVRTRDPPIIHQLNAAAREGRYDDARWVEWTGHSLEDLNRAWIEDRRRAGAAGAKALKSNTAGPTNDTARLP